MDSLVKTKPHYFLGMRMAQNSCALLAMSDLLIGLRPTRIIEIGTRFGGFTAFLGMYCRSNAVRMVSYDITDKFLSDPDLLAFLGVEFRKANVFDEEERVGAMIARPGSSLVLCDGGNKRREAKVFSKYLKPGDILCAHDYRPDDETPCEYWRCAEIRDVDVSGLGLRPHRFEPMRKAAWLCLKK